MKSLRQLRDEKEEMLWRRKNRKKLALFYSKASEIYWKKIKEQILKEGNMAEKQNLKVIEIHGTKFEVDLSKATKVEEFRVGDRVKVLQKASYGEKFDIFPGVIIGFEWFEKHPTITIAYVDIKYSSIDVNFLYYNSESKDVEISHTDNLELLIKPNDVIEMLDKEIHKHKVEIEEIELKKKYFLKNFKQYFKEFVPEELTDLV